MNTKSLKPGDIVALYSKRLGCDAVIEHDTVERVTPGGQVILVSGRKFNKKRREVAATKPISSGGWLLCSIEEAQAKLLKSKKVSTT